MNNATIVANSLPHNEEDDNYESFMINAFNDFNRRRTFNANKLNPIRFDRSRNSQPFRGKCHACGQSNHHAKDCTFLGKMNACLDCMEKKNISLRCAFLKIRI